MSTARAFAIAMALVACSETREDRAPQTSPPPPADAAAIDGITSFGPPDPDAHLDEDPTAPVAKRPASKRPGRPIEVLLRSSPPGAIASVDGVPVGPTPTYWVGETGAEHEFTFSLPKHALARYRFFPIATGTLHARLDPVANEVDAGVPPAHAVQPPLLAPPETLVAPAPKAPDASVPLAHDAAVDVVNTPIGPAP